MQTWRTATLARQDQDKYSEQGRMAGLIQKIVAGCGIKLRKIKNVCYGTLGLLNQWGMLPKFSNLRIET